MFKRAVEYYRLINRPRPAEESKSFRVAVLLAVLLSVIAAVVYGEMGWPTGILVTAGVVLGFYYSYRVRHRSNLVMKFILTIILLVVFVVFWTELLGAIWDIRYPLVRLFLWVQVLHSFDLPTRRDLDFSLVSATVLMAFAGSMSISSDFLYLLVPFFVVGLAALYLGHRSALASKSAVFVRGKGGSAARALALTSVVVVPLTLVLFMAMPRIPGFSSNFLPVSSMFKPSGPFNSSLRNPGYLDFPDNFPSIPLPFNPNSYYGFNRFLDLRTRGVPSDRIVMKVRSTEPAYWRAMAFDRFLGNGWEDTEKQYQDIESQQLPLMIDFKGEPTRYATRELVQTFFIENELPNTVFAAFLPRHVFFPTRFLKVDSMFTVITPLTLTPGLIYTVISEVSDASSEMLRQAAGPYPQDIKERYMRLPEMSPEVENLARRITADKTNEYDRVVALDNYLRDNFAYDINCPRQGNDENTVEFFLFRQKRGYCEHFSTALAVMCRSIGIPARIAVGYATGELNPLTGYYEVSARDAHAWVEVYFPIYGWIPFDPTPGSAQPQALTGSQETWSGFSLLRYIGQALSRVFPASWGQAITGAFRKVGTGIGNAAEALAATVSDHYRGILAVLALFLLLGGVILWRLKARRDASRPPPAQDGPRLRAIRSFERMTGLLAGAGYPRSPSQTPMEYADSVESQIGTDVVRRVAEIFGRARFSAAEPSPEELITLDRLVDEVEASLLSRGA
jgi:transglutaminase-like putative cysteine protease